MGCATSGDPVIPSPSRAPGLSGCRTCSPLELRISVVGPDRTHVLHRRSARNPFAVGAGRIVHRAKPEFTQGHDVDSSQLLTSDHRQELTCSSMALVRTDGRTVGHGGGAGRGHGRDFDVREGTACEEFDPRLFSDRKLVPEDSEGCARMCDALTLGTTATSEHRRVRGVDHGVNLKRCDVAVPRAFQWSQKAPKRRLLPSANIYKLSDC